MQKIARFFKVSEEEFLKTGNKKTYDGIILPRRATKGSAGYDFFAPEGFSLAPKQTIKIATGIRVKMKDGWVLQIFPRSGLGFKYRLTLDNTVGIIDADYFNAENEGHIFIKMTNCGDAPLAVEKGKAFAQGVFIPFGITEDDECETARRGGLGSTDASF
ncbi:MAG: dUTP diphosphatase [Clostridia bacterium]|nr:dUTP diphosphatase [Clostridia bacterium]